MNGDDDADDKDLGRGRTQAKHSAREFDAYAERIFELPQHRREQFPGSDALARALRIERTKLVKSGRRRHLRHIAGLLRDEGFTTTDLELYVTEGTIPTAAHDDNELATLRDRLCDPETFDAAFDSMLQLLPLVDSQEIRRLAAAVHKTSDRRSFTSLYRALRLAADALEEDE